MCISGWVDFERVFSCEVDPYGSLIWIDSDVSTMSSYFKGLKSMLSNACSVLMCSASTVGRRRPVQSVTSSLLLVGFSQRASYCTTGVHDSLKPDLKCGFTLGRHAHDRHYQSSCPNMVTETFGRRCRQTSHCTAGQWHSVARRLWLTRSQGFGTWVLATRTRAQAVCLSFYNSFFPWWPWLIWRVQGQGVASWSPWRVNVLGSRRS